MPGRPFRSSRFSTKIAVLLLIPGPNQASRQGAKPQRKKTKANKVGGTSLPASAAALTHALSHFVRIFVAPWRETHDDKPLTTN
jgi:hypothetical protein